MTGAPLDPVANHLRYLVLAIQAEGERRLNDAFRAEGLDLTATQSEVLEVLYATGPLSQTELGERLVCTKGNISRLVDRMIAKDLLRRHADRHDRRRVRIELTDDGRATIEAGFPVIGRLLQAIRTLYDERELDVLRELLSRLSRAFGATVELRTEPSRERSRA